MNQSINTDSKNSKEPQQKYRLGTVSIIPASWYKKALPDKLPNISPQCSRMSLNTMRGKPGQQFSIYCTFPDHIQPTLTGHFQFRVQNYGIAYQRILETAHQSRSVGLNAN